jgi:hypothetical protein
MKKTNRECKLVAETKRKRDKFSTVKTRGKVNLKILILLLIVVSMFIISCTENPTSFRRDLTDINWNILNVDQVDYDSLFIENKDSIVLQNRVIDQIFLYTKENFDYILQDSLTPNYTALDDGYYINFRFNKKVASGKLYYEFTIRYKFNDGSFIEIDTTHLMLKYPYKSAKVLFTADRVWSANNETNFQDIDFYSNKLFFHPTGPLGLYEYSLSGGVREIVSYTGGDFIAHDSTYIFVDINHTSIKRYNIELDDTDLEFDLSHLDYQSILGMECWKNYLYVMFRGEQNNYITKFDYEGNYISSIPYSRDNSCLTIESGIAYSYDYDTTLSRFELSTKTFLSDKQAPTSEGEGIRIHNNYLFFVDWKKQVIGYIPLYELE